MKKTVQQTSKNTGIYKRGNRNYGKEYKRINAKRWK